MVICKNCGAMLDDEDVYCKKCGTKIDKDIKCPKCGSVCVPTDVGVKCPKCDYECTLEDALEEFTKSLAALDDKTLEEINKLLDDKIDEIRTKGSKAS